MADYIEDPVITWLLTAICNSHLIKNPYLVAKIVEVLFVINLSVPLKLKNVYEKFMDHPMSQTALASSLMKFYTDIETTGQSTEFYDKFTIRFHISIILKGMWERPIHKQVIYLQRTCDKIDCTSRRWFVEICIFYGLVCINCVN